VVGALVEADGGGGSATLAVTPAADSSSSQVRIRNQETRASFHLLREKAGCPAVLVRRMIQLRSNSDWDTRSKRLAPPKEPHSVEGDNE
jgi:hypothetical protein